MMLVIAVTLALVIFQCTEFASLVTWISGTVEANDPAPT